MVFLCVPRMRYAQAKYGECPMFLFLALLLALVFVPPAAANGDPRLITHGPRSVPAVALTFDLCQTPTKPAGFDREVVAVLRREGVAATFFVGGLWLDDHPGEAAELAAEPLFELANHSVSHPDLRKLSKREIVAEVEGTEERLRRLTGRTSHLFRLPFGWYDPAVLDAIAASGVRVIQWDVVSGDPDPKVSAAAIITEVRRAARNGSIIIMHANGRGRHTAAALPQVIAELRRRGLRLVTVSQLLSPVR